MLLWLCKLLASRWWLYSQLLWLLLTQSWHVLSTLHCLCMLLCLHECIDGCLLLLLGLKVSYWIHALQLLCPSCIWGFLCTSNLGHMTPGWTKKSLLVMWVVDANFQKAKDKAISMDSKCTMFVPTSGSNCGRCPTYIFYQNANKEVSSVLAVGGCSHNFMHPKSHYPKSHYPL